ncbi:MAG TPA: hypothetical protein VNA89_16120 [Gemmatimonadaceae bacterium]|nr:hypothetical protein [Gemmatimonadaceae bacterium]
MKGRAHRARGAPTWQGPHPSGARPGGSTLYASRLPRPIAILVAFLAIGVTGCVRQAVREHWYPMPELSPVGTPPEVRGTEGAAAALPPAQRMVIVREVVRGFFRPRGGQARWIDPRPLSHHRLADADSRVQPDPSWADAIVDAVGLPRVCALDAEDPGCSGRPGGVLRLSAPYAADTDSAVVFARYTPVAKGATPVAGPGFELEFHLARRDGGWRIVGRRSVAGPDARPPQ